MHTVTRKAFRSLLKILNPRVRPMGKYRVRRIIAQQFAAFRKKVMDMTANVEYICLTADIWSSRRRSFLGVTAHWLTPSFQRVSFAIALHRFKGNIKILF